MNWCHSPFGNLTACGDDFRCNNLFPVEIIFFPAGIKLLRYRSSVVAITVVYAVSMPSFEGLIFFPPFDNFIPQSFVRENREINYLANTSKRTYRHKLYLGNFRICKHDSYRFSRSCKKLRICKNYKHLVIPSVQALSDMREFPAWV
jgi:hypothetical protein